MGADEHCDHVTGVYGGFEELTLVRASSGLANDIKFRYCPMCGAELEHE